MHYFLIGLGNPGDEYAKTRHNTGRMVLEVFRHAHALPDWEEEKKYRALSSAGKVGKKQVVLLLPETFMNKSVETVRKLEGLKYRVQKKIKEVTNLVVIHDDLDIPLGSYKISFNKSAGGHRGVAPLMSFLKTEGFLRVRVGISPSTPKGTLKKPKGEAAVEKHILGKFSPKELEILTKLSKKISEALYVYIQEGREKAMSQQGSYKI